MRRWVAEVDARLFLVELELELGSTADRWAIGADRLRRDLFPLPDVA